jgi:ethanolamine-phosphate cytidylyltransferase
MDGAFDMFHPGHVEALRAARAYGDFLLCGVHTDDAVSARRGPHLPILSLHERSLSVLACRYVDEVVIGAPEVISADFMTTFNIATVVHGTVHEPGRSGGRVSGIGEERAAEGAGAEEEEEEEDEEDPYALPKALGKFVPMGSPKDLTTASIIGRILGNRQRYEERNRKKSKSEADYLKTHKARALVARRGVAAAGADAFRRST